MKKIFIFLGFVFSILLSFSQQGEGGQPQGYAKLLKSNIQIPEQSFKTPDVATLRAEDRINDELKTGPWRFGYKNNTSLTLHNSGIWKTLANGDRVWLLKVSSNEAITMNLIFSNTEIPNGNKLYVFNPDQSFILGSFTQKHLYKGELGTELIPGDEIIVEYYVPAYNANNLGNIEISAVTHGYRSAQELYAKSFGSSGSCNMNVNCPDGAPYINQRNSAIMVIVGGTSFCSGALINNTNFDGTPYVLTANHCYNNNYASTVFRFNWQADDCNNPSSSPSFQSITGAESRAKRLKSDFWLMEITAGLQNGTIPQSYSPFFAGWDRSNSIPSAALSIHHPAGDIKKISFEDDAPAPSNFTVGGTTSDPNGTWRVEWDRNTTTEGGSSGSPLFNQDGLIIGQLWGGNAGCVGTSSSGQDYYGRLYNSWEPSGSSSSGQLKHWLDPTNSGSVSIGGYDPYNSPTDYNASVQTISGQEGKECLSSFTPSVDILNKGVQTITSMSIKYTYNGTSQNINWTGNIASYATETITLPIFNQIGGNNAIAIEVLSVNGQTDQDIVDNIRSINFYAAPQGVEVALDFYLGCYATEVSWEIRNNNSDVIYSGSGYGPNSNSSNLVSETMCFTNGCYELILMDSYGDGVEGAAYSSCGYSGSMTLTQTMNNQVLAELLEADANFGSSITYNFCITTASLSVNELENKINVYPNPSKGIFNIAMDFEGDKTVTLTSLTGQVIGAYQVKGNQLKIDESDLASGLYMLTISNENNSVTRKIIVE